MGSDCYLMNFDGAVPLRCLYITTFPHLMLLFVNSFMLCGEVVVTVSSALVDKLYASDIYFQSKLFKRWRQLLY